MQRTLLLPLALVALFFLPPKARACWEGYEAVGTHLLVVGLEFDWSAERARELALWIPRIDALLAPRDIQVEVHGTTAYLPNDRLFDFRDLEDLFDRLARELGVSRAQRRAAMRLRTEALTVEIFASRDEDEAYRQASRLNEALHDRDDLDYGFYGLGEFPGEIQRAQVLSERDITGRRLYRVIVGAFFEPNGASALADALRPIADTATVRPL